MNNIVTRKALTEKHIIWGRSWWYEFRQFEKKFDPKAVRNVLQSLEKRYAALCIDWTEQRNSEWICRNYLSAKMIMAATIQINSLEFASERNLRIVGPYLRYYAIFLLLRGIVFTLPEQPWNDGQLSKISHKRVMNLACDYLRYLDVEWAQRVTDLVSLLRHQRELTSYWQPSSGDGQFAAVGDIIELATTLAEIAQFNSEILERAIVKKADPNAFVFLDRYAEDLSQAELVGHVHFDREDAYRLNYLLRKYPFPTDICHTMTEGHVDDFFIAWCSEEPNEQQFNPDKEKCVIFDLP